MNKENIYFAIGIVAFQCGACMIHYGLGLMLLGAWFLLGSFLEYEKNNDEEDDELKNQNAKLQNEIMRLRAKLRDFGCEL